LAHELKPIDKFRLGRSGRFAKWGISMERQKQPTGSFKARVALEAIRGRRTIAELSVRYKVDKRLITTWKQEAIKNLAKVFAGHGSRKRIERRTSGKTTMGPPPSPPAGNMRMMTQSYRAPPKTEAVGTVDDDEMVHLTVVLKPAMPYEPSGGDGSDAFALAARHRTSDKVMQQLARYARKHGLEVRDSDATAHTVKLTGNYRQARDAFRPESLAVYRHKRRNFVGRAGHLWVPAHLAKEIVAVMGFDQRPIAQPFIQGGPGGATLGSYDPVDVGRIYGFPADVTGRGEVIALIELGGSYDEKDVNAYFSSKNIRRTGALKSVKVGTEGAGNVLNSSLNIEEVQLDIDIAGSIAPGADIVVYFAPNTAGGLRAAIEAATGDPATSIVSISWGSAEWHWTRGDKDAIDQAMAKAASTVTFCVASGDNGSTDPSDDTLLTTNFPASSPHVLACGGTTLPRVGKEIAWQKGKNASGGGFSDYFDPPSFQSGIVFVDHRGIPDVSANADLDTGYNVRINGADTVRGGTSAAAPLWAGLIALVNEKLGKRVGFANDRFYRNRATAFNDIAQGGNGRWTAVNGWDPVTGLGSPIGGKIVDALR
jgi:kumamolisin